MHRRSARLFIALMAAMLATTCACTSGSTGQPVAGSTASVASSPAFPSESVPAGVQKDSVLDLNSTKDMTGVVTTVPFGDSPYAAHLPDICTFIPDSVMKQLGVDTKDRGFRGTQLVVQACNMQHIEGGDVPFSVTVNFYTNNLKEISAADISDTLGTNIRIGGKVIANITKLRGTGPDDATYDQECGAAWGTFFGAIVVRYRTESPKTVDPCARSVEAASLLAPFMPKSPSQMRAAP